MPFQSKANEIILLLGSGFNATEIVKLLRLDQDQSTKIARAYVRAVRSRQKAKALNGQTLHIKSQRYGNPDEARQAAAAARIEAVNSGATPLEANKTYRDVYLETLRDSAG